MSSRAFGMTNSARRGSGVKRIAILAAMVLSLSWVGAIDAPVAVADTAPASGTPVTAGATALPTAQINGVVWAQSIVGNRVFVGGSFTAARPAGTAAGSSSEVPRANLMAYNLVTGELDTTFAPVLNGQVKAMALSPDKSVLYVAGQFTSVDGFGRYRVAAFNTTTGALLPFAPNINATVNGITATPDRIYVMGSFTTVGGAARDGAASILLANTQTTAFNPIVAGGDPRAVVTSPDGTKVVIGGNFTTVNGSGSPGYGLAMVTADTGASLPLPVNSIVRDAATNGSIMSLVATSDGFYGGGYTYNRTDGNLEGMFKSDWNGNLVYLEDCHGDTYSVYATDSVVYTAGHAHFCGNVGGFLQPTNWVYWRGLAWSNSVGGTIAREHMGYYNFEGQPRPNMLDFFPDFNIGTFTGLSQGPWEVTGDGNYVVFGGEFTKVNGTGQQGLVRFAYPNVAKSTTRPEMDTSTYKLRFTAMSGGQVLVNWPATWDRDNELLTYQIWRNSVKVYQGQASSRFYQIPQLSFVDTGLVSGQAYDYSLRVLDPDGNAQWTTPVSYTYQPGPDLNPYNLLVLGDHPSSYWRLNEGSATSAGDLVSGWNGTRGALVAGGAAGAISGSTDTAYTFSPTTTSTTSTVIPQTTQLASNVFTAEAWFKTTSTRGGAVIDFGTALSGNTSAGNDDRVIYLSNDGRVYFGIYPGVYRTINSTAKYNDGKWHHVAATLGLDGAKLYLDGQLVASNASWTEAHNTPAGIWRIGGDRLNGWTNAPSNSYLSATIDEVAVYPVVLNQTQLAAHYTLGSTGLMPNQLPVASVTTTVNGLSVAADSAGSNDPDGTIASYSWDFGDGSAAVTGAMASHTYASAGTYTVTLTVVDNRGGSATASQAVSVQPPNQLPVASFAHSESNLTVNLDASASADPDGQIVSYAWDFGDGTSGSGVTASHTYSGTGTRMVTLTVTDNRGGATSTSQQVSVLAPNQLPTAAFTWSAQALQLSFDASGSADPDGTIASYNWDFGDGTTGSGVAPQHTYTSAGDYTVKLVVADNRGGTATVSKTVTASVRVNAKPVAVIASSANGLKVSFDGTGSTDSDGTVASYAWDFGDGTTSTNASPVHTYGADGAYVVTLIVTDNEGATSAAASKSITVVNAKPKAAFSSSTNGVTAAFDGADTSDADGSIASYAWDYGDGSTGSGVSPSHQYVGTGTYIVKLTVTDNLGASDSVTHAVTVGGSAIVADGFNRTATRWGNADTGGTWTYANPSYYSLDGSSGVIKLPSAGASGAASLASVSARDVNVFAQIAQDTAFSGGGTYNTFIVRQAGTSDYRMTVRISSDGTVRLNLTKRVNGTSTSLGDALVSGLTLSPGDVMDVRFVASGNGTTTLEAKAWKQGASEPASAQLKKTDTAPELQSEGAFGINTYLSGTVTVVPVTVRLDNLLVTAP